MKPKDPDKWGFLGVDPGLSGGFAVVNESGKLTMSCGMLETEHDIAQFIRDMQWYLIKAVIEVVHAWPKQGVSSTGKFMKNYGFLRGVIVALQIPMEDVAPQVWQRYMNCLTKGDKTVSKARAQQVWPDRSFTHRTADASLLAEYLRLKHQGKLPPPIKIFRKEDPNHALFPREGTE